MPGLDIIKIVATILIVFQHYQQITGSWWEVVNFYSGTFNFGNHSLWTILLSALGVQDGWFAIKAGINNPTWYISVLLLCYIVLYLLVTISERLHIS